MSTVEPATRVRQIIDEHTSTGPYTPRLAAAEIVEKLRETEPEVLSAWLDEQAEHFVWQAINDRDRSRRGHAVHTGRSAAFREARESADAGDAAPLHAFLDMPLTVEDGSRRRLAEMRRDDLQFVAQSYEERARQNGMKAAFMGALAKKVGRGTVADEFTEGQLSRLWSSLAA